MIKRMILCTAAIAFCAAVCAQKSRYASIKGVVLTEKIPLLRLSSVKNGKTTVYATTNIAPDKSFGFLFAPQEAGFYTIGVAGFAHTVYVKPGDEVNINITGYTAELAGTNTGENSELYRWISASQRVREKSGVGSASIFKDFYPALDSLIAEIPALKQSINSGNAAFDALLRTKIDYDLDLFALNHLYTPRSLHPKKEEQSAYYAAIVSDKKYASPDVLSFPDGMKGLFLYLMFNRINNNVTGTAPISYDFPFIPDPTVKGEFVLNYLGGLKSYAEFEKAMQDFAPYLVTSEQQKQAEMYGSALFEAGPGRPAADFTYPDGAGKNHTLSDFKGKVVMVDLWATWCGPCREQFPHLKKLEQKMQGKDVVFIGISIDSEKDKDKWKAMIRKEQLPGLHLYAGNGDSKITTDYKVKSIPRYLVFDKQGRVVSADAPRPDNPALEKMLEEELKK
jgi:thiol-disulfide isomerase/thioredoxin